MFVGVNEKLKKKIQEFNTNSDWFIFSQGDLEPNYNEISGKRYNIVSPELKQKLGEVISQRKTAEDNISASPTIIETQLSLNPNGGKWNFGPANYYWWFVVAKKHIYQQARASGGNRISLTSDNEKGNWSATATEGLGYIFGDKHYRRSSEWKEICQSEKQSVEEKRNNFWNTRLAGSHGNTEIKKKIEEANMEIAEVFADGEYFNLRPTYCFCGDSPVEQAEYYRDHIMDCLDREERVIEFKNEIVKIIERSVGAFNQRRKGIIDLAKQEAQNKGVQLEFGFWEETVYQCRSSEQLNNFEKRLNDLIQTLANLGEEMRKAREKTAREQAQEEQEQAERERKKQEQEKKEREEKAEQKAREQTEKLQKEQEEREREAEERFKSSQDSNLSQEKGEVEQKIADLQKKLHDQEKLGDAANPLHEKEKRDLEKQLWDLRMNNLANNPSNDRDNPKRQQDDPANKNSGRELGIKKSNFSLGRFFFLGIFIIGGIIIIFLVIKRKRKN